MDIEYEVGRATLEDNLENLTTHFAGVCFDVESDQNAHPDVLIQGSLVIVDPIVKTAVHVI